MAGAQPFSVVADPRVLAVMDFHSHLLSCEIIGFLGGSWDKQSRSLHLREAFPCRSIAAESGAMHVELDPLAEVQVRQVTSLSSSTSRKLSLEPSPPPPLHVCPYPYAH